MAERHVATVDRVEHIGTRWRRPISRLMRMKLPHSLAVEVAFDLNAFPAFRLWYLTLDHRKYQVGQYFINIGASNNGRLPYLCIILSSPYIKFKYNVRGYFSLTH